MNKYIDEYFNWIKYYILWMQTLSTISFLLSEKMKDRFWQYMRNTMGYEEFGNFKKKKSKNNT